MIFNSKIDLFLWNGCFVVANIIIFAAVISADIVSATVLGIIAGCDAFFFAVVITAKYFVNRKDRKKYREAIESLRRLGVFLTIRQYENIVYSGFGFDKSGQIVKADIDGSPMTLKPGHRIVINRKGYPMVLDENGNPIKEPREKNITLITLSASAGTVIVIFGFVALCMFLPWVGVPLLIASCLTLLIGALILTKHKSVEKYIVSRNSEIRPILQKIHETILETNLCAFYGLGKVMHFPHYYSYDKRFLIAVQPTKIPYKGICVYLGSYDVFTVFADRLKEYKISGNEIYFPQDNLIDYDLIKDIVIFQAQNINLNLQSGSNSDE